MRLSIHLVLHGDYIRIDVARISGQQADVIEGVLAVDLMAGNRKGFLEDTSFAVV